MTTAAINARQSARYASLRLLASLVLFSLLDANSVYLKHWLRMCPRNMVTVLIPTMVSVFRMLKVLPEEKIAAGR